MKIKSAVLTLFVFSCVFVVLPITFIQINNWFSLPDYQHPILKVIGVLLIILGIVPGVYTFMSFQKIGKGTPVPIEPPKKLVIDGLHRYSRNPMYIGYLFIFFGIAFLFGHALLFAYAIFMTISFHFAVMLVEEPELKKRFGKEYEAYLKQVPRWF